MRVESAKRLLDAYRAANRIIQFVEGLEWEEFADSILIRSAVERQFEIVGEALSKVRAEDPDVAAMVQGLAKIVGLRNRLIHGYDTVDDEIVWDIVQTKINPLALRLEHILEKAGYDPHR